MQKASLALCHLTASAIENVFKSCGNCLQELCAFGSHATNINDHHVQAWREIDLPLMSAVASQERALRRIVFFLPAPLPG